MYYRKRNFNARETLFTDPTAVAYIKGSSSYPDLNGTVGFYQTDYGVLVEAELFNLPVTEGICRKDVFAFHIHKGASCRGNAEDEFADVGTHYNPNGCFHPYHAGDMPPLFAAGKRCFLSFLTDRFTINEIIGKTVIIHSGPDDFTTQPSGNAGEKIACGEIEYTK